MSQIIAWLWLAGICIFALLFAGDEAGRATELQSRKSVIFWSIVALIFLFIAIWAIFKSVTSI